MSSTEILEWVNAIGSLVCSWPVIALLAFVVFRKPLSNLIVQFTGEDVKKAKVGPFEIERELGKLAEEGKQAIDNMNRLSVLMAESRLLELEITQSGFGPIFSPEHRQKMQKHIDELRKLTQVISEGENEGKCTDSD